MLFQIESNKSLDENERGLQESAARHQFGVIAVHDLQETLKKKGVNLAMECRIYEVCNPRQAQKVLDADGAISTAVAMPHFCLRHGEQVHAGHHASDRDDEGIRESRNRGRGTRGGRGDSSRGCEMRRPAKLSDDLS